MHLLLNIIAVILLQTPAAALQSSMGSASGVVRNAAGAPAVGVRVAAVALPSPDTGAGEGALISLAQTDSAGRFKLENIIPGRYYIQAGLIDAPTYYPGVTTTAGATSLLIIGGNSINDLNFTMSRGSIGVRVSGHVPTTGTRPYIDWTSGRKRGRDNGASPAGWNLRVSQGHSGKVYAPANTQ